MSENLQDPFDQMNDESLTQDELFRRELEDLSRQWDDNSEKGIKNIRYQVKKMPDGTVLTSWEKTITQTIGGQRTLGVKKKT